jgi:hypothetical protein
MVKFAERQENCLVLNGISSRKLPWAYCSEVTRVRNRELHLALSKLSTSPNDALSVSQRFALAFTFLVCLAVQYYSFGGSEGARYS